MGGILSSTTIRRLVIHEEKEIRENIEIFKLRQWDRLPTDSDTRKYKFIIKDFDPLSLTPFSYDLSIGDHIFSSIDRRIKPIDNIYRVKPREMIIIISKEFIALPPTYAATVWPRFTLVRRGLFQSMVKIDPTWYGKLAVALTNISSSIVTIKKGEKFGTLILYELDCETDINLFKYNELKEVSLTIPKNIKNSEIFLRISREIEKEWQSTRIFIRDKDEDKELVIKGIKQEDFEKLKALDKKIRRSGVKGWEEFINQVKDEWVKKKTVEMEALGMNNLEELIGKEEKEIEVVTIEKVRETKCSEELLEKAALQYGEPFDIIANIKKYIEPLVEEKMANIFARDVIPKVFTFVISVFGLLSLIVAILALLVRSGYLCKISIENYQTVIFYIIGIVGFCFLLAVIYVFGDLIIGKLKKIKRWIRKYR